MTVQELIDQLKQYDPTTIVKVENTINGYSDPVIQLDKMRPGDQLGDVLFISPDN